MKRFVKIAALLLAVCFVFPLFATGFTGAAENETFESKASGHPRLYYTEIELAALKARADDERKPYGNVSGKEMAEDIIKEADLYLAETSFFVTFADKFTLEFTLPLQDLADREELKTPPEGYGSYPYWTYISRRIQQRMEYLSLASVICKDSDKADKYAAKAIEYADSLCSWSWWSDKNYDDGTTCLDTTHLTYGVLDVYDMLYDRLSETKRDAYRKAIIEKAITPLTTAAQKWDDTNIQVMRVSALISSVCALLGDMDEATANNSLTVSKEYFRKYLETVNAKGKYEGLLYTTYCMEYAMVAFDHLKRVTGDDELLNHEYIKDFLMKWAVAAGENSKNYTALISDSTCTCSFDVTSSILNKQNHDGLAGYYLKKRGCATSGFNAYIYHCDDLYVTEPDESIQSVVLDRTGWGCMRTGWNIADSNLVFTCSASNQWHNHWDNNSFVLADGGTWLVTDAGYATNSGSDSDKYTWSYGHSCIYVDGEAQTSKGTGKIDDVIDGGFVSSMTGNARASYPSTKALETMNRHFMMVNHTDAPYYLITDDISSGKSHEYTCRLNVSETDEAYADGERINKGDTTDKNTLAFVGDSATLGVNVDAKNNTVKLTDYKGWGKLLDITSPDKEIAEFISVLTPVANDNVSVNFGHYWEFVNYDDKDGGYISGGSTSDGHEEMMFLPYSEGASYSVPIPVAKEGTYDVTFNVSTRNDFGNWDIYLDGEKLCSYEGYAASENKTVPLKFDGMELTADSHTLKFISTSAGEGGKYGIGMVSFEAVNKNGVDDKDKLDKFAEVKENLSNEDTIACKVAYGDEKAKTDLIAYARGEDEKGIDISGLKSDGSEAAVYGLNGDGFDTGYSAGEATSLEYNGASLMTSDKPVGIAVSKGREIAVNVTETSVIKVKIDEGDKALENIVTNGDEYTVGAYNDGMAEISVKVTAPPTTTTTTTSETTATSTTVSSDTTASTDTTSTDITDAATTATAKTTASADSGKTTAAAGTTTTANGDSGSSSPITGDDLVLLISLVVFSGASIFALRKKKRI